MNSNFYFINCIVYKLQNSLLKNDTVQLAFLLSVQSKNVEVLFKKFHLFPKYTQSELVFTRQSHTEGVEIYWEIYLGYDSHTWMIPLVYYWII